jgi:hypothetical protein
MKKNQTMKKYNKILVSHQNVDDEEIEKLIEQLEENECEVVVSELEEKVDELPKEEQDELLIQEIDECELVFVLIGPSEEENECVKREIEEANRQEKRIIGIYMGGGAASIPSALENFGSGLITNDIIKIVSILQGNPSPWEAPSGGTRQPTKKIDKPDC